jgi:hypothetical protein
LNWSSISFWSAFDLILILVRSISNELVLVEIGVTLSILNLNRLVLEQIILENLLLLLLLLLLISLLNAGITNRDHSIWILELIQMYLVLIV